MVAKRMMGRDNVYHWYQFPGIGSACSSGPIGME